MKPLVKSRGRIGWFAVAIGAGDQKNMFFLCQFVVIVLADVRDTGLEMALFQIFDEFLGQAFGITGLRSIQHRYSDRWT